MLCRRCYESAPCPSFFLYRTFFETLPLCSAAWLPPLDELLKANDWLSTVPSPHNRHSFTVGAFVGSEPVFALVSNFEQPSDLAVDPLTHAFDRFTQELRCFL
jgi:hypothetical protein